MRRWWIAPGLVTVVMLVSALAAGPAAAAGTKLVQGTLYDTTCAAACTPECPPPPHCGPITQAAAGDVVCARRRIERMIACPLHGAALAETSPPICLPAGGCVPYPVYSGEGAEVKVRRRGSSKVLAALPVVEGHFEIRLGAGQYVFHPYLPEEPCWSGTPWIGKVSPREPGPIPISIDVSDSCVAHPGATK